MLEGFNASLDWGNIAALVAAGASVIGLVLLYRQISEARRTFEGQTFLALAAELQAPETRAARAALYRLAEEDGLTGAEMLANHRDEVEPALHRLDALAIMLSERMLPERPLIEGWGPMIVRCWQDAEPFIVARRQHENRPDLWHHFQQLAERARVQSTNARR